MSQYIVPLPQSARDLLDQNSHPGLLLDKYVPSCSETLLPDKLSELVQKPAVAAVVRLSQQEPEGLEFSSLLERRTKLLAAQDARVFRCTTTGPLTLHLARASALENAGICLHPVYGFVYLPGTGLKGMARAYAETVWFPTEYVAAENGEPLDQEQGRLAWAAWQKIERVFGWAPGSDEGKRWRPKSLPKRGEDERAHSGSIVFHDAWPAKWPRLFADILNSHHREYYGADDKSVPPPGDWETPVVVSFLAVPKGQTFSFGIAARRRGVETTEQTKVNESLKLATEWLLGALSHEGAGAKTAAGYGCFRVEGEDPASGVWRKAQQPRGAGVPSRRAEQQLTLKLVTPGFFAGQHQFEREGAAAREDCQLRPSTLRGQLRWWWRIMHAAHVAPDVLRRLEAAVWGDTKSGGAVRVSLVAEEESLVTPHPFDRHAIAQAVKLDTITRDKKTSPGLTYHSYGMDERDRRRFYVAPGARWTVTLAARPSRYWQPEADDKDPGLELDDPQLLLEQAQAALWLLCHFGGVGAKSRKGFGCFADPAGLSVWSRKKCEQAGARFRLLCHASETATANESSSAALEHMLELLETDTPWKNYWLVLDRLGAAAQQFAQQRKHDLTKKALGLPRRVRPPYRGSFRPGKNVQQTDRHASPVFYHAYQDENGQYGVRVTAFPAAELPDFRHSREFLLELLSPLETAMEESKARFPMDLSPVVEPPVNRGENRTAVAGRRQPGLVLPKAGERVMARLSTAKTKKGGWKASYAPANLTGPIQNSKDVPADKQPGDSLELTVAFCNPKQIAFRYQG